MINMMPIVSVGSTFLDWPTKDDHALIVYIAGCKHNCKGCQSPDLQDEDKFKKLNVDHLIEFLEEMMKAERTNKIIFSGGDPLYHSEQVQYVIDHFGNKCEFCIYTGFDYKQASSMISGYSFIKTGMYDVSLRQKPEKTDERMVLASSNQEIHDGKGKLLTKNGILKFQHKGKTNV